MAGPWVAVTGGTGFVGRAVVRALLARGARPSLLKRPGRDFRRPREAGRLVADVVKAGGRVVEGDVHDPGALAELVAGASCVIHLVGLIRERVREGQTFERVVVEGTRATVHAARAGGVRRLVLMSALGADPASPLPYPRTKGLSEQVAAQAGFDELVIFRPSVIYGPGDGFVNTLARILRKSPVFPIFGDGAYRLQPVSVDVVAQAVALAATASPGRPGVRIYDVGGPQTLSYRQLLEVLARVLRRRVLWVSMPLGLARLVASAGQHLPGFPITRQQLELLVMGSVGDARTFYEEFRVPEIGFEEGVRAWLA